MEFKQVIVVRKDVPMSTGKLAVQVAHAAVSGLMVADDILTVKAWFNEGRSQKKIVLEVPDYVQLRLFSEILLKAGVHFDYVVEAGINEVAAGTVTAIGTEPLHHSVIDPLTKHLKTYRTE